MESVDKSSLEVGASQESGILTVAPKGVTGKEREDAMIAESQWSAVHTLRQQGHSKKAIAHALDLDVKTVRKWLKQPWVRASRESRASLLSPYEAVVLKRAPEVGFNGVVLLRELREIGFGGSYVTLARYLKPLRPTAAAFEPTVRFETPPGYQAQVDWGQTCVWLSDQPCRVHLFTMVLGYSRRLFARAYENERLASLLDGHRLAFEHFGGRTQRILYDNPRTIVKHKDADGAVREWNAGFKDQMDFYGVEVQLCRYYRPQTKGKIERGVAYVKGNALAGRRFVDLAALNSYLEEWCLEVADQRVHGTTGEVPAVRFARDEQQQLLDVSRRAPAAFARREVRRVAREGVVAVETNRYPVPYAWAGLEVPVFIAAETITIQSPALANTISGGTDDGTPDVLAGPFCYRRRAGRYEVASWSEVSSAPRTLGTPLGVATGVANGIARSAELAAAPHYDLAYLQAIGVVEERSLAAYEQLLALPMARAGEVAS